MAKVSVSMFSWVSGGERNEVRSSKDHIWAESEEWRSGNEVRTGNAYSGIICIWDVWNFNPRGLPHIALTSFEINIRICEGFPVPQRGAVPSLHKSVGDRAVSLACNG